MKDKLERFFYKVQHFDNTCSKYDAWIIDKIRYRNSNMMRAIQKILKDME